MKLSDESLIRFIERLFRKRGVIVRREKLSRGPAFRVKSGDCLLAGNSIIFVDRRLPAEQQLAVLVEYLVDAPFDLPEAELKPLPASTRALIASRRSTRPDFAVVDPAAVAPAIGVAADVVPQVL